MRLVLAAFAMTASGALLLVGERSAVTSRAGSLVFFRRRCENCQREAEYATPHGRLCRPHTRMALNDDDVLWMPKKLR